MIDVTVDSAQLIATGARRLHSAGLEHSAREARWIWESLTGFSGVQIYTTDRVDGPEFHDAWERALCRRGAGEPLAHVLGQAAFRDLTLHSDARGLIPRPETEGLVDLLLSNLRTGRVLDACTGSGCIALSLAKEGEYHQVLASDISSSALCLARENVALLRLPVGTVLGDLTTMIASRSLDVLVSNPPYLSDDEYQRLDESVKSWEPAKALVGGPDGLDLTRRLMKDGLRVVRPGGLLALELDCSRAAAVCREAVIMGWSEVSLQDDLFGRARYLLAWRSDDSDVG